MEKLDVIDFYIDFVRPLYAGKDAAHDFRHIERMISRCGDLAEGLEPPPCPHKLNFLACFHGLGPQIASDPELRAKTVAFLRDLGWARTDVNAALSSLATHLSEPQTSEEMIVYDANYFEVTGAFGSQRHSSQAGREGKPMSGQWKYSMTI